MWDLLGGLPSLPSTQEVRKGARFFTGLVEQTVEALKVMEVILVNEQNVESLRKGEMIYRTAGLSKEGLIVLL